MAKSAKDSYNEIRPFVTRDVKNILAQETRSNQYTVTPVNVHTHNTIDSPAVKYTNLTGVGNYNVSNTIVLSPAQILTLHTTPVVLVAPPTTNSVIIVASVTARITFGGTAYTGGNNLEFRYTNGSGTKVTTDIPSTFINSGSGAFAHAPAVTAEFTPISGGSGLNGQIVVTVPTADPAAGNGIITLITYYHYCTFSQ